jgi:hypothetical protein
MSKKEQPYTQKNLQERNENKVCDGRRGYQDIHAIVCRQLSLNKNVTTSMVNKWKI